MAKTTTQKIKINRTVFIHTHINKIVIRSVCEIFTECKMAHEQKKTNILRDMKNILCYCCFHDNLSIKQNTSDVMGSVMRVAGIPFKKDKLKITNKIEIETWLTGQDQQQ